MSASTNPSRFPCVPCADSTPRILYALCPQSTALKLNAVTDWWDEYIVHDALKRLSRVAVDLETNEWTALIEQPDYSSINGVFIFLNQELQKMFPFHEERKKELFDALQTIEDLISERDKAGPAAWEHYMDGDGNDDDE